ncbi:hypothetical protein [Sandaracinus amylolyticus]|uniref:Lipoprotein n=1 Tax=Sandaracinus amylolyticus TaxID=927083 RepID=A0A0F6SI96_9BACT|nr:hypothetical protein [Sandaracinus amylolyticus]AKF02862.1 hypothetical protein DB32_000010 [Sandaracinus amylolyticus]AKF11809.1 hypothetical protein DB32_008958 [Sandaracinus amylolyticus]
MRSDRLRCFGLIASTIVLAACDTRVHAAGDASMPLDPDGGTTPTHATIGRAGCEHPSIVSAPVGTTSTTAVVALYPVHVPFEVTHVEYELAERDGCDASRAHRVRVLVSEGETLDASALVVLDRDVHADAPGTLSLALDEPAPLDAEQRLWVEIDLGVCLALCPGRDTHRDAFRSDTRALEPLDADGRLVVRAVGIGHTR